MPPFTFTILQTFYPGKPSIPAGGRSHKNPHKSNHLARAMVEEDAYNRKKRARQEEMEEIMEKKRWEQFKE